MGRIHGGGFTRDLRFDGVVVDTRQIQTAQPGSMGACLGLEYACEEAGTFGGVLAGRSDQHTVDLRHIEGEIGRQALCGAHQQGNEKEPWFPRPLIQELDMHMPLLNMDNQQGKLEER